MSYITTHLLTDETVVYRTELHWRIYIPVVVITAILLALFVGVVKIAGFKTLELLLIVPAPILMLGAFLRRKSSEFAVTNRRVIMKAGVLQTRSLEILLNKIEAIAVSQGVFGKMMNYGDIVITGSGGTKEVYTGIQDPLAFRRAVQETTRS